MTSLPIPGRHVPVSYRDVSHPGGPLSDLVSELTRGRIRSLAPVHLDPDLWHGSLPRAPGWRPAFGQEKAAQSHLAGSGVRAGDLFLFFGWFRKVDRIDGTLRYVKDAPDLHVLFGWLQVGEIVGVGEAIAAHRELRPWLSDHPHLNSHAAPGNTVYLASDRLKIGDADLGPGAGTFGRYRDALRLTRDGAASRLLWSLPSWFLPETGPTLTYHRDPTRWEHDGPGRCLLKSVARGQEFVFDCDGADGHRDWIANLFDVTNLSGHLS